MDTSAEKVLQFLGQEEDMLDQHKDRCIKLMEYQVGLFRTSANARACARRFTEIGEEDQVIHILLFYAGNTSQLLTIKVPV